MYNFTLTAPISLFVSLAALTGVTIHDTKTDKLATSIISMPSVMTSSEGPSKVANFESSAHTHVERISLSDMKSSQPRLAPRTDYKKHLMQKNVPKGANRSDGYSLPL